MCPSRSAEARSVFELFDESPVEKKRRPVPVHRPTLPSYLGGGGGSRTRVRGHVGKDIYVRSLRIAIRLSQPPQAGAWIG